MLPVATSRVRHEVPLIEVVVNGKRSALDWEAWERWVTEGRVPPDAEVRIPSLTDEDFVPASSLDSWSSLYDPRRIAWRARYAANPVPWFTALLIGVQIRIWWLGGLTEVGGFTQRYLPKNFSAALEDGETWRLLTMGVVHFDLLHIASNMAFLAFTGVILERALGARRLLLLYLVSVFGGAVLSMLGSPMSESVGASGGVFGLIAATVVFGYVSPDLLPERARQYFGFALLPYLMLFLISGLQNPSTDNFAHLGGALAGGLLAVAVRPPGSATDERRHQLTERVVAASVLGTLLIVGISGPMLIPLWPAGDAFIARRGAFVPPIPDNVGWSGPKGWTWGTNAAGEPALTSRSPHGPRAWSVLERRSRHPKTPRTLLGAWLERTQSLGAELQETSSFAAEVAGVPGEGFVLQGVLPDGRPVEIRWATAIRGLWSLEEVWQVEPDAVHLGGLASRLSESTRWNEPIILADARRAMARTETWETRRQLAEALSDVGQLDAAATMWSELIAERPDAVPARLGHLRHLFWYADREEALAGIDTHLAALDHPTLLLEAVSFLERVDSSWEGKALLEEAWTRHPGDRVLGRALRRRGLASGLTQDGRPVQEASWPLTNPRPEAPSPGGTPLQVARAAASQRQAARELVANSLTTAGPSQLLERLVWLQGQHAATEASEAIDALFDDLEATVPPAWWPIDEAAFVNIASRGLALPPEVRRAWSVRN